MTESFTAKIKVSGAELDCEVHLDSDWKVCKITTHKGLWRIPNRSKLYEMVAEEYEDDIAEMRRDHEGEDTVEQHYAMEGRRSLFV